MCSSSEQLACERKDAKYDVDATVVNKDESSFVRRAFQPLQPVVKGIIQPRSCCKTPLNICHAKMLV